jgi:hypothetical protein
MGPDCGVVFLNQLRINHAGNSFLGSIGHSQVQTGCVIRQFEAFEFLWVFGFVNLCLLPFSNIETVEFLYLSFSNASNTSAGSTSRICRNIENIDAVLTFLGLESDWMLCDEDPAPSFIGELC